MKTSTSLLFVAALGLTACSGADPTNGTTAEKDPPDMSAPSDLSTIRFAVFNVLELSRDKLDQVDARGRGTHPQLAGAAEVVQRIRPDVLLVNEIDFDPESRANARLFADRYLAVGRGGQAPIDYPHVFFEPVNTGVQTGLDMDGDGRAGSPEDAYGFGRYPGEYVMALLSRHPIDHAAARTFQKLLWRDQPGHLMPDGTAGRPEFYGPEQVRIFRLSSKSHWDVPVVVGPRTVHVLASHPTPTVFDGDEDSKGRRNFDEIRLWADYLSGGEAAAYVEDDRGRRGGLDPEASVVVMGDLNADPVTDPAPYGRTAISQLLEHPRLRDPEPRAADGRSRTSGWGRIDYVLPSRDLVVRGAGVFWPVPGDPLHRLVADAESSSDHRLVWVDIALGRAP
jgi:hypothetical protein